MELFDDQVDIRNEKTPAGRMWKATLDSISRYNPLTIHWGVDITRLEMVLLLIGEFSRVFKAYKADSSVQSLAGLPEI